MALQENPAMVGLVSSLQRLCKDRSSAARTMGEVQGEEERKLGCQL